MHRILLLVATVAVLANGFAASAQQPEAPPQEPAPAEETRETGSADEPPKATREASPAEQTPEAAEAAPPTLGAAPVVTPKGSIAKAAPASRAASGTARIVITDSNLREVGSEGLLTVGGGVTAAGSVGNPPPGPGAEGELTAIGRLGEQEQRLRALEERLRLMDEALADPSTRDPYRLRSSSPYNRPPGVRDESGIRRDQLAAEVEKARAQLDRLRAEAREEGLVDEPASDSP